MVFWDRETLKLRAKEVLKKSYWMAFLVTFIFSIVQSVFAGSSVGAGRNGVSYNYAFDSTLGTDGMYRILMAMMPVLFVFGIFGSVLAIAYTIFVSNLAEIGKNRFFTLCRYNTISIEEMLFGFKNGKYMSNVKTMLMRGLYTFLWGLLFFVPGIVKGYSYWMIPYILAENPNISTERAFEISMRTTQNEKWEMFVLDLSFIGWYLLGLLACGVGVMFVSPYHEAAKAELYGALRFKAINTGICEKTEIGAEL
ncbi:MAG: DUF975 family protein [Oscillospiraceae bacterium]